MFSFFSKYKIIILIFSILIPATNAFSIFLTSKYKEGEYAKRELALKNDYIIKLKQKQEEYNKIVEELNRRALEKQNELSRLNVELEKKYVRSEKEKNEILSKYNTLIANGWRLRDPGRKESGANSNGNAKTTKSKSSTTTCSCNGTSSSRELSKEASEFLLRFAIDADKVVDQLKICQEYATKLRDICEKQ